MSATEPSPGGATVLVVGDRDELCTQLVDALADVIAGVATVTRADDLGHLLDTAEQVRSTGGVVPVIFFVLDPDADIGPVTIARLDDLRATYGTRVVAVATFVDGLPTRSGVGVRRDRVRINNLPLAKGNYSVTGYLFDPSALHIWDQAVITDCLRPRDEGWSLALLRVDHRWDLDAGDHG